MYWRDIIKGLCDVFSVQAAGIKQQIQFSLCTILHAAVKLVNLIWHWEKEMTIIIW